MPNAEQSQPMIIEVLNFKLQFICFKRPTPVLWLFCRAPAVRDHDDSMSCHQHHSEWFKSATLDCRSFCVFSSSSWMFLWSVLSAKDDLTERERWPMNAIRKNISHRRPIICTGTRMSSKSTLFICFSCRFSVLLVAAHSFHYFIVTYLRCKEHRNNIGSLQASPTTRSRRGRLNCDHFSFTSI